MNTVTKTFKAIGAEINACLEKVSPRQTAKCLQEIGKARRVFVAGAGRTGLAMRGFAMRLMHMGKAVHLVGEATTPPIARGDLLIIGSGSGRTESLLAMATKARKTGVRVMLVTIDRHSPIGSLADCVLEIPASSPKALGNAALSRSIQPMGSLFEQCAFIVMDSMILLLMKKERISAEKMFARHANLE